MDSSPKKLLLLGASTGGPGLIEHIFDTLDSIKQGSMIIAQHMNSLALESFASRLHRLGSIEVICTKEQLTKIDDKKVYVLYDTSKIVEKSGELFIQKEMQTGFYHPTIDELFSSAARLPKTINIAAYLLSGIGDDGVAGLKELRQQRPDMKIVAQDEQTSKVYGMPRCAKEAGVCSAVLSINDIAHDIKKELL